MIYLQTSDKFNDNRRSPMSQATSCPQKQQRYIHQPTRKKIRIPIWTTAMWLQVNIDWSKHDITPTGGIQHTWHSVTCRGFAVTAAPFKGSTWRSHAFTASHGVSLVPAESTSRSPWIATKSNSNWPAKRIMLRSLLSAGTSCSYL